MTCKYLLDGIDNLPGVDGSYDKSVSHTHKLSLLRDSTVIPDVFKFSILLICRGPRPTNVRPISPKPDPATAQVGI